MKRAALAVMTVLCAATFAHAQLPTLVNAGFESPNVGSGSFSSYQYAPTGAGWTFNGTSGISGNSSGFTSGNPSAPEGTQVALLQQTGFFSQSFTTTSLIDNFSVSFFAAQRVASQTGSQTFSVSLNGSSIGIFTPGSSTYSALSTAATTLAAGTHTLSFTGLNPSGGDNTVFIDSVQLNGGVVVPEMGTIFLLGIALPLVGGSILRRRKLKS